MASPSTAFRETAEFKLGRGGEHVIARELMKRGRKRPPDRVELEEPA